MNKHYLCEKKEQKRVGGSFEKASAINNRQTDRVRESERENSFVNMHTTIIYNITSLPTHTHYNINKDDDDNNVYT